MYLYNIISIITGYFLDIIIGDPVWLYHPIRFVGRLISFLEKRLRKIAKDDNKKLFAAGILLVILVTSISTGLVAIILFTAYKINVYVYIATASVFVYFILASKSLKDESMKVYHKLKEGNLSESRKAVAMIVGRDTDSLDEEGVTKATIETVAENLSDGVIAPLLYLFAGGVLPAVFYKAVNTMDSMVGYKNDKYIYFGRAAAKLDDIVNFIPSRIAAGMLIIASILCGKDYKNAVRIFKRDRYKHASPNSAQTESVCAGALRIRLAGDAYYFGKLYKKPFIGDACEEVSIEHIKDINKMMYAASFITMILGSAVTVLAVTLF